jgi:6-phosphofructokinase 1
MTTGGDCSGLNSVIWRLILGAAARGWETVGILDGTDGLSGADAPEFVKLTPDNFPPEWARLSGSWLKNGRAGADNFQTAARANTLSDFNKKLKRCLAEMKLDALILIGGNGSLSLAHCHREIYAGLQLVCIPKTIDMDIPKTDCCIGFATAVQSLVSFCDQLLLTARSHHRWFVVQTMGRDTGHLALSAGVAIGADAILIPEIKFKPENLAKHIKNSGRDYGIILVSEGIELRGHSGKPAEMIARELSKLGVSNRTAFPEHTQRAGDTDAGDRLLAARFADCALNAVADGETYVMTALSGTDVKTVSLTDFFEAGDQLPDPNIPGAAVSNSYVSPDDPLLGVAVGSGIYIGEIK